MKIRKLLLAIPLLGACIFAVAQPANAVTTPRGGVSYYYEAAGPIKLTANPEFCLSVRSEHYNPDVLARVMLVKCGEPGWWQNWSLVRYRGIGHINILGTNLQISQSYRSTTAVNVSGNTQWHKGVTFLQHNGSGNRWQFNAPWKNDNPGLAVEPHPRLGEDYYASWLTDTSLGSVTYNVPAWHKCDAAGCE